MSTVDTNNKLADPEVLNDICAHVAEGGNLVAFCKERNMIYKLVNRWIAENEERAKRYKLALDIREQHAKDLILGELIAYMKAKPLDAFEVIEDGDKLTQRLKPMQDWPAELQRMVAGIEFEEIFEWQGERGEKQRVHIGRIHKIKFYDKPRNIETFMKHLQMLIERKQVDLRVSLADLIAGEKANAAAPSAV